MPHLGKSFQLYGWRVSYFTGKMMCYMRYKNIPFVEKFMTAIDFAVVAKRTGAKVMPVVKTPDNEWLQDTRDMIIEFEQRFPPTNENCDIFPKSPRRRLASLLLEAWGDEFWIPMAMHYRWNYPESVAFFRAEAISALFPPSKFIHQLVPSFIKNKVVNDVCNVLIGFLPKVGVRPDQTELLEAWTEELLSLLDAHLAEHRFLLGGTHPTIGDFGMAGPVVNHLTRDPGPLRKLFGVGDEHLSKGGHCVLKHGAHHHRGDSSGHNRHHHHNSNDHTLDLAHVTKNKHVYAWAQRMTQLSCREIEAECARGNNLQGGDYIPESLRPVLSHVFSEFLPQLEQTLMHVKALEGNKKFSGNGLAVRGNPHLPRMVGELTVPLMLSDTNGNADGVTRKFHVSPFHRGAIPFNLWKMQVVLADMKKTLEVPGNRQSVADWLDSFMVEVPLDAKVGASLSSRILDMKIPALKRENVVVKFVY